MRKVMPGAYRAWLRIHDRIMSTRCAGLLRAARRPHHNPRG